MKRRPLTPLNLHDNMKQFHPFLESGIFTATEFHAARVIVDAAYAKSDVEPKFLDYLSVAVAVWAPLNGHVCANLRSIDRQVSDAYRSTGSTEERVSVDWPHVDQWIQHLHSSPLVGPAVETDHDHSRPLVLRGDHLYLTRQWVDEGEVARDLRTRFVAHEEELTETALAAINEVFPEGESPEQREAVRKALTHNTSVLLGGPGTGKTYTIAAILHSLLSSSNTQVDGGSLRIALAAPTAKASRQIGASIEESSKNPRFPDKFENDLVQIGKRASTIHRLLGTLPYARNRFKHNRHNYLPFDVVIIDEVSMVSLSLMSRLLEALAPSTRLILVGDGEQLKSVENGAVLPEIAQLADVPGFPITVLTKNQRQRDVDGRVNEIAELAKAIRQTREGDALEDQVRTVIDLLASGSREVQWLETPDDDSAPSDLQSLLRQIDSDLGFFKSALEAAEKGEAELALSEVASIRILCGHRMGPFGVSEWNRAIAKHLGIPLNRTSVGLPLLNTRNDIRTGLVNGDTGIVVKKNIGSVAVFKVLKQLVGIDGASSTSQIEIQEFEPTSLESVEESFATTIHKAQGSQYHTTIVICPPKSSPLATRELIYTASTRATHRLVIVGSEEAIAHAIRTRVPRESDLAERIRGLVSSHD